MSFILMQQEADALLAMEKHYSGAERFTYPSLGGVLRIPLHSVAMREEFNLDITRGRIELKKNTFQLRAHRAIVLARIDDWRCTTQESRWRGNAMPASSCL